MSNRTFESELKKLNVKFLSAPENGVEKLTLLMSSFIVAFVPKVSEFKSNTNFLETFPIFGSICKLFALFK